jgi:glycosyltransferase A (GT-A) superfamily protein (DUF2064 family)
MLKHTVHTACSAKVGSVELCVTPGPHDALWQSLALSRDLPAALEWTDQGTGDLGARMARAVQRVLAHGGSPEHDPVRPMAGPAVGHPDAKPSVGSPKVILIGTDCPALGVEHIRAAAAALCTHDAVLIPASDGGYVLLGCKQFEPTLFNGMPWSTATVATLTLDRMAQLAWTVQTFSPLHDIDEPADLQWLAPSFFIQ